MQVFRRVSGQFGGFLAVGAVNTILSILLYEVLILFLPYWLAYALCFPAGMGFLLFVNANLVFGRAVTVTSAISFVLFYLVSYAAGLGVIIVLVDVIRIPAALAPFGAVAIMTPINFVGSRLVLGR
jgi:putative flippase GtrA